MRLRERVPGVCDELLDAAAARGQMELVGGFALPLPITIIGDLLGISAQDRLRFHAWSRSMVGVSRSTEAVRALPRIWALFRLLRKLFAQGRADPRDDLVTFGSVTVRPGELVAAVLGSANRDERQFTDPEILDLGRDPNRHLAFGQGPHFCLGAPLARLEGRIALTTLLRRFPDLRLAQPAESLRWRKSPVLRGLEALPVTL